MCVLVYRSLDLSGNPLHFAGVVGGLVGAGHSLPLYIKGGTGKECGSEVR